MFDKYGIKVTFFVTLEQPTDFCYEAIERGHEIGLHTVTHVRVTELSEEDLYEQAIKPIENFKEHGIELTTFAYPYGDFDEETNMELINYYETLRGLTVFRVSLKMRIKRDLLSPIRWMQLNMKRKSNILKILPQYWMFWRGVWMERLPEYIHM